jgi:hypothetical protein
VAKYRQPFALEPGWPFGTKEKHLPEELVFMR